MVFFWVWCFPCTSSCDIYIVTNINLIPAEQRPVSGCQWRKCQNSRKEEEDGWRNSSWRSEARLVINFRFSLPNNNGEAHLTEKDGWMASKKAGSVMLPEMFCNRSGWIGGWTGWGASGSLCWSKLWQKFSKTLTERNSVFVKLLLISQMGLDFFVCIYVYARTISPNTIFTEFPSPRVFFVQKLQDFILSSPPLLHPVLAVHF